MKKTVAFLVIILVVVGIIAIKNSHDKKVAKEQREEQWKESQNRAIERAKADREERYKEYKTLLEIIAEYAGLEKGLTTEAILSAKPREKYAKELLGSEINLYVILYDIKQENSRRVIDFWGEVRPRMTEYYQKYNPQDIIFKFYDDKKIITDVTKGTRLDIKAKITRAVLRGDIMYMDFEIIGLITDYSQSSRYYSTTTNDGTSYVELNDGRDIIVDDRFNNLSYEQGMRW
jgi:hypothetical protein